MGTLLAGAALVTVTCAASFGVAVHPRTMAVYGLVQRAFYAAALTWLIAATTLLAFG